MKAPLLAALLTLLCSAALAQVASDVTLATMPTPTAMPTAKPAQPQVPKSDAGGHPAPREHREHEHHHHDSDQVVFVPIIIPVVSPVCSNIYCAQAQQKLDSDIKALGDARNYQQSLSDDIARLEKEIRLLHESSGYDYQIAVDEAQIAQDQAEIAATQQTIDQLRAAVGTARPDLR